MIPDPQAKLVQEVEEFVGWWHLHREGSVNRTYDYIDKLTKRLRALLEAGEAGEAVSVRSPRKTGCINCGEANDGGYETEEVGPFCSQCWQSLQAEAVSVRSHRELCVACNGNGVVKLLQGTAVIGTAQCPNCHGDGWASVRSPEPQARSVYLCGHDIGGDVVPKFCPVCEQEGALMPLAAVRSPEPQPEKETA